MALCFIKLVPYAAEKEGAVPLPPMFIARNMAITNGIRKGISMVKIIGFWIQRCLNPGCFKTGQKRIWKIRLKT
jgi:hypothetical protein